MIKYNQAQTGTPEFKMKEAQTRADMSLQNSIDAEEAKRNMAFERARKSGSLAEVEQVQGAETQTPQSTPVSGSSFGVQQAQQTVPSLAQPGVSPFGKMPQTDNGPRYITVMKKPETTKFDSTIGANIKVPAEYATELDPAYLTPDKQAKMEEDRRAEAEREQSVKDAATQNLESIAEAKKGSKYFGPLGNLPSVIAPSTITSLGQDYGNRKIWESNVNQLLSQKVVDLITKMKSTSKTGATGFGQLSEKEGQLLREASTALNKELPEEKALYYLNEMEKINKRILEGNKSNIPSFNSIEEADASGYKGPAIVGGVEGDVS
jgi:hypothetical protein